MCGIAGIIGHFNKAVGRTAVQKMLYAIQHRGPDSRGVWSKYGFAFGMQRLSIIDIGGGDQPIFDKKTGVGIVFNGEIYNFKALRSNLENTGTYFQTCSDTEVILQLYIQKGMEAIQELEGMFGICLYDPRIQKVFLIRDRLGVKPLYYYHNEEVFIFGSEIKSILQALSKNPGINYQSLWHYLTLRYSPSPESIWDGVYKLEPAHYLAYDLIKHKFSIKRYWAVEFNSKKIQKNRNYEREFETLFLEAVEKRLLASDVPVGILLSGGLDSSCVAAAAVELGHKNFHTFSIGFEDGGQFSELSFAKKMASHIGSNHHEVIITQKQFVDFIDQFVWHSDEPLADLASIPLYHVSKLASKHVKVVLSGEGADEVLAGYNLDKLARKLIYLKASNILPNFILELMPFRSVKTIMKEGYSNLLKSTAMHITQVFSEEEKATLCRFSSQESTKSYIRKLYDISSSLEPIDQLQQAYCQSWLVEDLLMKADKMSMATSLELRVPFLDHKLVEWAATLPLEWKIGSLFKSFTTKRILRSFAKNRIPEEIIERPKQGFPVPAYDWIQTNLFNFAKKSLLSSNLEKFFKKEHITSLLEQVQNGDMKASHKAWNLIILEKWIQKWKA
jgi:asparagine synthase (glutamine-hydrolysing)